MMRDAARLVHRHERRRGQIAAAGALVAAPRRGLGGLDLQRRGSFAAPFLRGVPVKCQGVDHHYGILAGREGLVQGRQQNHRNKHKCRNREKGVCGFGQHIREKTIASWNSCRSRWKLDAYGVGRWAYEDATDIYFFSATIGVDHTSDARVSDTPRSGRANKSFQLRDLSSCGGCPHSLDSPLRFTPGAPCEPPRANRDLPRNCPKKTVPRYLP
jgi:hypothetical protein